ncbi:DMT family transporter [Geopsychrobacter electrodiphilus]|uniref:DMT family transporter n=1 Tax=Geopsychrobacter electrodiphilus TaxID=225196 RepID=UPI000369B784|nr:DMT family transporter [Geopsychrobacter electrodiphilus]
MSNLFLLLAIFIGGAAATVQPPINARLAEKVGILEAATVSFLVGTLVLVLVSLSVGRGSFRGILQVEWWQLTGGLFGAFFVTLTILAVPKLGTGTVMAALIVAQLATGVVFDHFGLFGMRQIPFDLGRLAGVVLLMVGVALIYRR